MYAVYTFLLYVYFYQLMDVNEDGVISEDEFLDGCRKVSICSYCI